MQAIGAVLASFISPAFLAVYGLLFTLFVAYSYPRFRLKGRPLIGLFTIALGQGVLAGLAGAAAAGNGLGALTSLEWMGLLGATTMTTGFYLITQIYQVEEDRARGDLTFAAWAGIRGTFTFAILTMSVASLVLVGVYTLLYQDVWTVGVAAFCSLLVGLIAGWARHYQPLDTLDNYHKVMRLYRLMNGGFLLFLSLRLLQVL
jgi:4-hydroxybenzoate polyprenyltransferase